MGVWRVALSLLSLLASACGAPVVYPRSAEIQKGLGLQVHTNVSHGDARVRLQAGSGYQPEQQQPSAEEIGASVYEGHASSPTHSFSHPIRLLGTAFSTQGGLSYAPLEGLAVGGFLGLDQSGVELRGQPLSERAGAPLSAALSVGALPATAQHEV